MFKVTGIIFTFLIFFTHVLVMQAQEARPLECGSILEDELTTNQEIKAYSIPMSAGDVLNVTTSRLGDQLKMNLRVLDSAGNVIATASGQNSYLKVMDNPELSSGVLSASGSYTLEVSNHGRDIDDGDLWSNDPEYRGGIGVYTLYIGCTLRDGTVINPGDIAQEDTGETPISNGASAPTFSGVGFPGLAPVDFSAVAKIPMLAGTPMTGAVTPTGSEILGYTLDASGGEVVDLSISKLSGNLNLGVVVLSADNEVVFQASLVTSQSLTTRLTLPSPGQYTIGVFRIDLLPPASPEATAFQVQAVVNPG